MLKISHYTLPCLLAAAILPVSAFATTATAKITVTEVVQGFVNLPTFNANFKNVNNTAQLNTQQSLTTTASITSDYDPVTHPDINIDISSPQGQIATDYNGQTLPYMTIGQGQQKDRIYFDIAYKPCGQSNFQNMLTNPTGSGTSTEFHYNLKTNETTNCSSGNQGSFRVTTVAVPATQAHPASGNYANTLDLKISAQ